MITTSYRLIVRVAGKQRSSGTAWFVAPNLVATAFHVVGDCGERKWIHQDFGGVSYHLEGDPEIRLKARSFDPQTDVAVLVSETACEEWLPLASVVPRGERWLAEGYPGFHECKPLTLSGTVAQVYEGDSGRAVQLTVEQGTDVDWSGVSGSAVVVGGRVAALLTEVTRGATTAWGAPATALEHLVKTTEVGDEVLRLLPTLGNESGAARWRAQIAEAPQQDLARLLDYLAEEYPESGELKQMAGKARDLARKPPKREIPAAVLLELRERYVIVREEDAGIRPKPAPRREFNKVFERNQGFAGRVNELARLDRFIAGASGGYFFVTGQAGFGKTSLLAKWIESLTGRGLNTVFHFLTRDVAEKIEADKTFTSLCEQLMSFHRLGGKLELSRGMLEECYAKLLKLPPPKGMPLVVVMDGLDEALPLWTPSSKMFPADLGGVHVVFSARAMAKNWVQDLGLKLDESCILHLGQLNRAEVREALAQSKVTAAPELADRVFDITDGDPFYLSDVVRHLKANHDDPDPLKTFPHGHSRYLQEWWDSAVESVTRPGFEDLMGTAALLHAPLPSRDLVAISDEDELREKDISLLLKQTARYIEGDEESGYELRHQRIKNFVRDRLEDRMAELQDRLAGFCTRWNDPRLSERGRDYVLRYAVAHLEAANRHDQATGLITAAWLAAQWKHFSSYRGVISDLEQLITAAAGRIENMQAVCTVPALALAKEDARDIMRDLPVEILRAWVRLGRVKQGVEFLDSLSDHRAEAREHLLGVAEELFMVAAERNDPSLRQLAKPLLERVLGTLTLVRTWLGSMEALDRTVEILSTSGLSDPDMRALAAQATAYAESREDAPVRPAALACAARLAAKFSQATARRLLSEAEETAGRLTSAADLLQFWSFALPVVRTLEPERVRAIVESNLGGIDRPPGRSSLAIDPLSYFLNRWDPAGHGEGDWAAPLVSRLATIYTGAERGPGSPVVFRLLGEFGQADRALELLHNPSLWNVPEIVGTLAHFRREAVTEWLDRESADPQVRPDKLAPGFAAAGNWDAVFRHLRLARPDVHTELAFLGCIKIAAQLPEAADRQARLDAVVEAAGIFVPIERKKIEAAAGLAWLRTGPKAWNDHLRSAIRHSLAKRPGDLDTLLVLLSVAYAQEGRFNESDAMAKRCRWLPSRVEVYTEAIRIALKVDPKAVHQLVDSIQESFVSLPAETFLDSALSYACDAAGLLVETLPDEATRLADCIEGWLDRGRAGMFQTALVRTHVRFARLRSALNPSQRVNEARALVTRFAAGIDSSQPCSELFDFLVSVGAGDARETLEGGRSLYLGFKERRDQIAGRADYAAALAKVDAAAATALFEDAIHEVGLWGRDRVVHTPADLTLAKQLFGDHPYSDTVVETLARIVAAIARAARDLGPGFAPLLRQAYAVALDTEREEVREAGARAFFRQAAATAVDREQDLCSVLTDCIKELAGRLTIWRLDRILLEGVPAFVKAGLQGAALIVAHSVTDPVQGHQVLIQHIAKVERRRNLSGLSPFEEYFVNHDDTGMRAYTLGMIREGQADLCLQVAITTLAKQVPRHQVTGVLIPPFLPLVCRKWGVDAARSVVDLLADFDKRWIEAGELIAAETGAGQGATGDPGTKARRS